MALWLLRNGRLAHVSPLAAFATGSGRTQRLAGFGLYLRRIESRATPLNLEPNHRSAHMTPFYHRLILEEVIKQVNSATGPPSQRRICGTQRGTGPCPHACAQEHTVPAASHGAGLVLCTSAAAVWRWDFCSSRAVRFAVSPVARPIRIRPVCS